MKAKNLFLVALVALLALGCQGAKSEAELTVVSLNIRVGTAPDGDNAWDVRKPATIEMINVVKPDIFGLQEAFPFQVNYIKENCPQYSFYGIGRETGEDTGEHMTIFYNTEVFELLDSLTFWLSETPEEPSLGWDAAYKRTATVVKLSHKQSGKKICYVNTHLDHIGEIAEREGLNLIVERMKSFNPEGLPMILTGDFNIDLDNPILEVLDGKMLSARTAAPITDSHYTYNAWVPLEIDEQSQEAIEENGIRTIDYIYYSGFECTLFETILTSFLDIPFISDHYPIRAVLRF